MAYFPRFRFARARLPLRRGARVALVVTCAGSVACADAPTYPAALHWLTDGEEWLAVLPPASLPGAADWARHGVPGPAGERLAARIAEMESASDAALSRGDVAGATRLRVEAAAFASDSTVRPPNPQILADAAGAVDLWIGAVRGTVRLEASPALAASVDSISDLRGEFRDALSTGDSIRAVRALIAAGERIRTRSPTMVAVLVVERAALRVEQWEGSEIEAARAARLIRGARAALHSGDPVRAIQRAMYALQLASGQQIADSTDARR